MKSLSRVRLSATLSPGDLSDPRIKPGSPALEADTLTSEPPGKPRWGVKLGYLFDFSLVS